MTRSKLPKTELQRAIEARERGITRMRDNIERIRRRATNEVAQIEARIKEKQVLLDALKRGALTLKGE